MRHIELDRRQSALSKSAGEPSNQSLRMIEQVDTGHPHEGPLRILHEFLTSDVPSELLGITVLVAVVFEPEPDARPGEVEPSNTTTEHEAMIQFGLWDAN